MSRYRRTESVHQDLVSVGHGQRSDSRSDSTVLYKYTVILAQDCEIVSVTLKSAAGTASSVVKGRSSESEEEPVKVERASLEVLCLQQHAPKGLSSGETAWLALASSAWAGIV